MADQHPGEDALQDLALSELDQALADPVAGHLECCEACRDQYDELAGALERVLAAAPQVAPPPGFAKLVLGAISPAGITATRAVEGSGAPSHDATPVLVGHTDSRPPVRSRRGWRLLAVAAASVLLAGVLGGVVGHSLAGGLAPTHDAAAASPLLTSDGRQVGGASTAHYEGEDVLVVQLDRPGAGSPYSCRFVSADGTAVPTEDWTWDGRPPETWIVPVPEGATTMQVVAASGKVWATAELSVPDLFVGAG
jgi:hypothetical protein